MTYKAESSSTRQLIGDLIAQVSNLISIETRLFRAELSEKSAKAASGAAYLGVAAVVLLAALNILLLAVAAVLVRLGLPADVACLIVAGAAIIAGVLLALGGLRNLKAENLAPSRSFAQLSKGIPLARTD